MTFTFTFTFSSGLINPLFELNAAEDESEDDVSTNIKDSWTWTLWVETSWVCDDFSFISSAIWKSTSWFLGSSCAIKTSVSTWWANHSEEEPPHGEADQWLAGPSTSGPRGELPLLRQRPVAEALGPVPHLLPELLLQQLGDQAVEAVLGGGGDLRGGRGQVQLPRVRAGAVHLGKDHVAEVQARHGGGRGAGDVPHQLVALHPLLQPLEGAVALPGISEEEESSQEEDGLEHGEGEGGEVVAVQVQRDEAGQVLEGSLLDEQQLVPVQVEGLQLHQVAEPGPGHVDQTVPAQVEHLDAAEALEGESREIAQQVVVEVEVLQPQQVLKGLVVDHVDPVLLEVQVPETRRRFKPEPRLNPVYYLCWVFISQLIVSYLIIF